MESLASTWVSYEMSKGTSEKNKAHNVPAWLSSSTAQAARTDVGSSLLHAQLKDALLTQAGMANEPEPNAIRKEKIVSMSTMTFGTFMPLFSSIYKHN